MTTNTNKNINNTQSQTAISVINIKIELNDKDVRETVEIINIYNLNYDQNTDKVDFLRVLLCDWLDTTKKDQNYKDIIKNYEIKNGYLGQSDLDLFLAHIILCLESRHNLTNREINKLKTLNIVNLIF